MWTTLLMTPAVSAFVYFGSCPEVEVMEDFDITKGFSSLEGPVTWYEIKRDFYNPLEPLSSCVSDTYEIVDASTGEMTVTYFTNYWPLVFLNFRLNNPLWFPDGNGNGK